jgi:DNA-binding GntR family transcriptional regulator
VTQLNRIERISFADQAYETLRASIVQGRYEPGYQLVEARLAAEMGVSRGPVREALKRLVEEGLVVDSLHRGSSVRVFTVDEIVDLYNVRIGLESVAIRLAAREGGPTEALRDAIDAMTAAGAAHDLAALAAHETAFHEALAELSGNDYISALFKSISAQVRMAMTLDNAAYSDPLEVAREHEPLVAAIERQDEDAAAALIVEHIGSSLEPALCRLAGQEEGTRAAGRLLVRPTERPPA